jgi:ribosome biogenesis GTPase
MTTGDWKKAWGWRPNSFEVSREVNLGRIVEERRQNFLAITKEGVQTVTVPGKLRHTSDNSIDLPVVGDWVTLENRSGSDLRAQSILPRYTSLMRLASGEKKSTQVLGANIDEAWILSSLNSEFDPDKIKKYLQMCKNGGVKAKLILTKLDLCSDLNSYMSRLDFVDNEVEIHSLSVKTEAKVDTLGSLIQPYQTYALLGSSGVGKSTLLNFIAQKPLQETREVKSFNEKGKHTTTARKLQLVADKYLFIDMPGLRDINLDKSHLKNDDQFEDLKELSLKCKFTNCRHTSEPACALKAAVQKGEITSLRLNEFISSLK